MIKRHILSDLINKSCCCGSSGRYQPELFAEQCISFLKKERSLLVGPQGLSLIRQLYKDIFPVGNTIAFDKREALWKDPIGRSRVPKIKLKQSYSWMFLLDFFDNMWSNDHNLLCINKTIDL